MTSIDWSSEDIRTDHFYKSRNAKKSCTGMKFKLNSHRFHHVFTTWEFFMITSNAPLFWFAHCLDGRDYSLLQKVTAIINRGMYWPLLTGTGLQQAGNVTHEIDITEDSLSDSPPVILSACSPRSPVRILTTSETGITGRGNTRSGLAIEVIIPEFIRMRTRGRKASVCMWQCFRIEAHKSSEGHVCSRGQVTISFLQ